MRFRPCIDIHDGKVKQIVGGSLNDSETNAVSENYVSEKGAAFYASMYSERDLSGGHIIMLNKPGTPEYEASKAEAIAGLMAYPGGMQIGGGIEPESARMFLDAGASHVIVTSYVFDGPVLDHAKLKDLKEMTGKEHLVLDLSCRFKGDSYYVVTDRWQTYTDLKVNTEMLYELAEYCDEFLIHGVDVEGLKQGTDERLLAVLAEAEDLKITYAGGVRSYEDIDLIYRLGKGRIDFTVGSALSIFGGDLDIDRVVACSRVKN